MSVSTVASKDVRRNELAPVFINLLGDKSRWVGTYLLLRYKFNQLGLKVTKHYRFILHHLAVFMMYNNG